MSDATVDAVCAGIVALLDNLTATTVDGVTLTIKASDPPPTRLNIEKENALPAVYVLTGESADEEDTEGDTTALETRSYRIRCIVAAKYQNTLDDQVPLREKMCRPLIAAIKAQLRAHPRLGPIDNVKRARVTGDSGPIEIAEYEGALGFEVRLSVTTAIKITFAARE
jgi:hypothetical protein